MRQTILTCAIIAILSTILFGCKKDNNDAENKVELYLIDSYSTIKSPSHQIDETTIKTKASPLIDYVDIVSYNSTTYEFELSDKAKNTITNMGQSIDGVAFAIKANGTVIYSGYFWPSYSSAGCDCVVIDPLMASIGNKIYVQLGYPRLLQGQVIPDKRNDSRIIKIFESDKKLLK